MTARIHRSPRSAVVLSLLLGCLHAAPAHPAPEPAAIQLTITAGEVGEERFSIRNACAGPQKFRIKKKKLRWLTFAEEGSPFLVGPGQIHTVELRFDTTGRKPGTYEGALVFSCKTCKKDRRCRVDDERFRVRVTVTAPPDLDLLARRLREIEARFETARAAVETRAAAATLLDRTGEDLERAFDDADPHGELGALEDWARDELGQVRRELSTAGAAAARLPRTLPGAPTPPRAVTAERSLAGRGLGTVLAAAARDESLASLLERVHGVLTRLIELIEQNDLKIDLTIASTPDQGANFQLLRLRDSEPWEELSTDGMLENVRRGLYRFHLDHAAHDPIEARLDLVREDGPLCCRLEEGECKSLSPSQACHVDAGH